MHNEQHPSTGDQKDLRREGKGDFDINLLNKVKKLLSTSKKSFILVCSEYYLMLIRFCGQLHCTNN